MSLRLHYDMNGLVGGLIPDTSGNGNHGTPTDVSFVAGKIGQAGSFNGTTSLIDVANPGNVLDGKLLTVCAWVYRNGVSGNTYPRVVDRVYNGQFACYVKDFDGLMGMAVKGVGGSIDYSAGFAGSAIPLSTWTHCAWVYDGTQIIAYVNGVQKTPAAANYGVLYASTSAIRIGDRMDGTNRKWKGPLDDVRIHDEVLPGWKIWELCHPPSEEAEPWQRTIRPVVRKLIVPTIGAAA